MATTNELRDAVKTIFWGILFTMGGFGLWYMMLGNPFHDLSLIRRGETAPGYIVDTWEDVESGDEGGSHWSHEATYKFTLPNGRELMHTTGVRSGQLKDEFRDLQQPYPIEVEYLPDNPNVSRIKGSGSPTVFDWAWRKIGLGSLLLAIFVAPEISIMCDGIRRYRACELHFSGVAS